MRLLFVHSEKFRYLVREKALKSAEDVDEKDYSFPTSCLVVFTAVEADDEPNTQRIVEKACDAVIESAEELKEKNVILYPWVHLSSQPSSPGLALLVLKELANKLKEKSLNIKRAPFGYYKAFDLHCKGHPLAERSKHISLEADELVEPKDKVESLAAIDAEAETKKQYFILDLQGNLIKPEEFNFKKYKGLKIFVEHETKKDRVAKEDPPHIDIMKRLELVDHESGTDAGNFRFYPKGHVLKRLLEDYVEDNLIDYGAMIVETPLMYNYTHPSLKSYLERFPSRQYVVKSGQNNYFLRFAACFGQFLMKSTSQISYRALPLKIAEIALSFRREQHGEVSGLRRLRAFTMPDIHTVVADFDQAKQAFTEQFNLSMKIMTGLELNEYETAFRAQTDFFEENKEWILEMVRELNKPVLIELFDKRYAYFLFKFEFNFNDSQKKSAALSTVQIDVENAERFDISYMDNEGNLQRPMLLHCSISGSIERCIYALLEKAYLDQQKGRVPELPLWLAPCQVRLIPVNEDYLPIANKLAEMLDPNVRIEIDDRDMTVGRKVRAAEKLWTPLIVVLGERETDLTSLNVRIRKEKTEKTMSPDELKAYIKQASIGKPKVKLSLQKHISKQPVFSRAV
ncbi:MAG: threonine--tRNA ligase [Promethearchaeota archaeon]